MRVLTSVAIVLLGAAILAGVLVGGAWSYVALAGLMVFMHLFGHGAHGHGGHEEHANHEDEASQ